MKLFLNTNNFNQYMNLNIFIYFTNSIFEFFINKNEMNNTKDFIHYLIKHQQNKCLTILEARQGSIELVKII